MESQLPKKMRDASAIIVNGVPWIFGFIDEKDDGSKEIYAYENKKWILKGTYPTEHPAPISF